MSSGSIGETAAVSAPYISLLVISGDAGMTPADSKEPILSTPMHRMLTTVLRRVDGPMVDEVVIGWNGQDAHAFDDWANSWYGVPIRILHQTWKNDFAVARNEVLAVCHGEWVLWLDTDDEMASAATPEGLAAINAVERTYGIPLTEKKTNGQVGTTLREWLRQLPWEANCIRCPYDYEIDDNGYVAKRNWAWRILRRSCGWLWRTIDGVHELPYPSGGVAVRVVDLPGFLVRHHPIEDAAARQRRNSDILVKMSEKLGADQYVTPRHAYDMATAMVFAGDDEGADRAIRNAIANARTPPDAYRYRMTRAGLCLRRGQIDAAVGEAFAAIFSIPERREAYLALCEAFYMAGQWRACLHAYRQAMERPVEVTHTDIDNPLDRTVKPAAQAAFAAMQVGEYASAVDYATEAYREYPLDPLAKEILAKAVRCRLRDRATEGLLTGAECLASEGEVFLAQRAIDSVRDSVSLRGATATARFRVLDAKIAAAKPPDLSLATARRRGSELGLHVVGADVAYYPANLPVDAVAAVEAASSALARVIEIVEPESGGVAVVTRPMEFGRRRITFYAPHGIVAWDPTYPERNGIGGSETSAIMLARELAARGCPVTMYCPGGGAAPKAKDGVTWYGTQVFDQQQDHGILVACRAPWVLRDPKLGSPTFIWHQDNAYENEWSWALPLHDRSNGSFHVSKWAGEGLAKQIGSNFGDGKHHVIGNGVSPYFDASLSKVERNPLRVVYASDPTRGLTQLLDIWPAVLAAVPDAELHVFGDFAVFISLSENHIGVPAVWEIERIRKRMQDLPRVTYHGLISQPRLAEEMLRSGVYAYHGGAMAEGFGVALTQAAAAGLEVVGPNAGALPEVLGSALRKYDLEGFETSVIRALDSPMEETERKRQAIAILGRHSWAAVANRFDAAIESWESPAAPRSKLKEAPTATEEASSR